MFMLTMTIWPAFQFQHLPCTAAFWFKREGQSNTTGVHLLVWEQCSQTWLLHGQARLLPHLVLAVSKYTEIAPEATFFKETVFIKLTVLVNHAQIWARAPYVKTP